MTGAAPDEQAIRTALLAGMEHHGAGRLAQAEAIYREVLEVAPNRPDALVLLGAAAHGRGRLDEALAAYRKALRHHPDYPPAYFNLGNALQAQGRLDEAIASYRRALALHPGYAEAHNNLAIALGEQGRVDEALAACRAALELGERPEFRANFARWLARAERVPVDARLRALASRAIAEAWARPADLALAGIGLIRADPVLKESIDRALRAWPARIPARELFGAAGLAAASRDPLLIALLGNAQACEWGLERFLTLARHALLEAALEDEPREEGLAFFCALARQCFLGDYVFSWTDEEAGRARTLRESLAQALARGGAVPALSVAAVAAYFPLDSVPSAAALLEGAWPEPVRAVLAQQLVEPRTERELRASIPKLTAVVDAVSRAVQRQYEESPYPRWVGMPAAEPLSLEAWLRRLLPRARLPSPVKAGGLDILVAGCGTGQESIDLARQFPDSRLLAVDLSLASLGYARRKARELGVANVEHAQADILELGSIGRTFDVVSSVGVLHHLADPMEGWRRLLALLRPGGLMQVGLYSEIGRRDLAAARELIAARGYGPDPEGIRRCREAMLGSGDFPRLALLRDLYGMNECRDLLFHVREHRFTLPQVAVMVEALGLEFLGLAADPAARRRYRQRFPGDETETDPASWHDFEVEFPDTFAGMYLFWVRKRAGPSSAGDYNTRDDR